LQLISASFSSRFSDRKCQYEPHRVLGVALFVSGALFSCASRPLQRRAAQPNQNRKAANSQNKPQPADPVATGLTLASRKKSEEAANTQKEIRTRNELRAPQPKINSEPSPRMNPLATPPLQLPPHSPSSRNPLHPDSACLATARVASEKSPALPYA
jgi:hypothetical protein